MFMMRATLTALLIRCTKAATAIEYAFIASIISIAIYAGAAAIGTNVSSVFTTVASRL
jgi:pilus assembly protein Flp/PilA